MSHPPGYVGAGIGLRRAHHPAVLAGEGPAVLEVVPDHFFAEPAQLPPFAELSELLFHDVGLSLGSTGPLDASAYDRLARIRTLIDLTPPLLFSEHLAATRSSEGLDLGHLCPIQYTRGTLAAMVEKIGIVQDRLRVPVALENIAAPFQLPGSEMSEAEFLCELCTRTDCGLLLDLTNLLYNSRNQGFDPFAALLRYPLDRIWQVHLAGGALHEGYWVDSHSRPVEDESLALLSALRGHAPVQYIVVERDDDIPALQTLCAESARAQNFYCNSSSNPDGSAQTSPSSSPPS